MPKEFWTGTDIQKLFKTEDKFKSIQTLYNAEERGEIPKAHRISRGKVEVRHWTINQIPDIGRKFGFLTSPRNQKILCVYVQKGGVLKTTTSFNVAQILALNGIKTLIIGQDFECSITDIILPKKEVSNLEDRNEPIGLYHFFAENAQLQEIIRKTHLPTLDIIPETHDLVVLDKWINQQQKREFVYQNRLIPLLKQYEVIIFDNGPSWNHLIENAIICTDSIICTLGCNLLAYNASETNLCTIFDFQELMNLKDQKLIMLATLLERSSLSQQIYAKYVTKFTNHLIPIPIRHSAKIQEALVQKQTIIEGSPNSHIAQDYYDLMKILWDKINN